MLNLAVVIAQASQPFWMLAIVKPGKKLGIFLFDKILVNFYRIYFIIKNKYGGYAANAKKADWIFFINNRWTIHVSILIITGLTLFSNVKGLQAENYIDMTLIKKMAAPELILGELITEDASTTATEKSTSGQTAVKYVQSGYLYRQISEQNSLSEEELLASQQLGALAAGSSAIIKQEISTTEVDRAIRSKTIEYTVQPGDTITGIASQFDISVNTILWENNLSAYSIIRPGTTLAILPGTGLTHVVKKGDSIANIAKTYQVESEAILEANRILAAGDLKINQKIFIPEGLKPKPIPATRYYAPPTTPKFVQAPKGGNFIWPTNSYRVTQYYSWRHFGLDIGNKSGQPVYASAGGTVIISSQGSWNGGYGNQIVIDHGNGFTTRYAHNSYNLVNVGDQVTQGQVIAAIGSTGRSTGPHSHFEIMLNHSRVNPLTYLSR